LNAFAYMTLIGVLLSLVFFALMAISLGRAITQAQARLGSIQYEIERFTARCEIFERECEAVEAETDSGKLRVEQAQSESNTMRDRTNNIIAKAQSVYYVFADRWTVADEEFIVPVRNTAMTGRALHKQVVQSWIDGRSLVVWAPRAEMALRQIEKRYPVAAGNVIGSPIASPLRLAPRWAYKDAANAAKKAEIEFDDDDDE
jgi:DNA repair exonuclease SbcCD ATPase subunit